MSNDNISYKLNEMMEQKTKVRKATAAAKNMMTQLQITNDNSLVYLIGFPEEKDNRDALVQWILAQHAKSGNITEEGYTKLLERLCESLHKAMNFNG